VTSLLYDSRQSLFWKDYGLKCKRYIAQRLVTAESSKSLRYVSNQALMTENVVRVDTARKRVCDATSS